MSTWEVIGLIGIVAGYVATGSLGYWLGNERQKRLIAETRSKLQSQIPAPIPSPDLPEVPDAKLPNTNVGDGQLQDLLDRLKTLLEKESKQ